MAIKGNFTMGENVKLFDISPESFYPKPKILSSLVIFLPKLKFENIKSQKNLEHITRIFFGQRRKMIKKPIKILFKDYLYVAEKLKLDLNLRPENISKEKYMEICKLYEDLT